jgi:hypothetical protein
MRCDWLEFDRKAKIGEWDTTVIHESYKIDALGLNGIMGVFVGNYKGREALTFHLDKRKVLVIAIHIL